MKIVQVLEKEGGQKQSHRHFMVREGRFFSFTLFSLVFNSRDHSRCCSRPWPSADAHTVFSKPSHSEFQSPEASPKLILTSPRVHAQQQVQRLVGGHVLCLPGPLRSLADCTSVLPCFLIRDVEELSSCPSLLCRRRSPATMPPRLVYPESKGEADTRIEFDVLMLTAIAKDFLSNFADANGEAKYMNVLRSEDKRDNVDGVDPLQKMPSEIKLSSYNNAFIAEI
ncbi:hypothetical protein NL676_034544 [Syzygium grande]|nr:hypothetical protein NL676_034544 [Syzygium grande]